MYVSSEWLTDYYTSLRSLGSLKGAAICSHQTDTEKPPPSDVLKCPTGSVINGTNVYIGFKRHCTDSCNRETVSAKCCQPEINDIVLTTLCLKNMTAADAQYLARVSSCNRQSNCTVKDRLISVGSKCSSYVLVEYGCIKGTF